MRAVVMIALIFGILFAWSVVGSGFEEFQIRYGRTYATHDEYEFRSKVYAANERRARELQARNPHARFGGSPFMDWTVEEFKAAHLTGPMPKQAAQVPSVSSSLKNWPDSRDWRAAGAVTNVYNTICGEGYLYAMMEAMESQAFLSHVVPQLTPLSFRELLDCNQAACAGGSLWSLINYLMDYGVHAAGSWNGKCPQGGNNTATGRVDLSAWSALCIGVDSACESTLMINYVGNNAPPAASVYAADWMLYESGVFSDAVNCNQTVDHMVQVVGYGEADGLPIWIVRNAWGADWGMDGYILLERDKNMCRISDFVVAVTTAEPSQI